MSWLELFSITMFWNNKIQQRKQRREKYFGEEERDGGVALRGVVWSDANTW